MAAGTMLQVLCSKKFLFVGLALSNLLILGFYQGVFTNTYQRIAMQRGFSYPTGNQTGAVNGSVINSNTSSPQSEGFFANAFGRIKSVASAVMQQGKVVQTNLGVDVHIEDPRYGHTGDTHHHTMLDPGSTHVAVGGGITTRKVAGLNKGTVGKLQFFTTFLPSFCRTASDGYHYHFYLGYDSNDAFLTSKENLEAFQQHALSYCDSHCTKKSNYSLHFVQCTHNKRPTWAQNDAMFEAYIDGVDYFYRINDDSDLVTKGWTDAFVKVLAGYKPKNIGVVGPNHHGGNMAILTYDFTHRTHVDIFGFYYPRLFTDWWGDDWVTKVYQPGRSTKMKEIKLTHTMRLGQRYSLVDRGVGGKLGGQLTDDKVTLNRYVTYVEQRDKGTLPKADGTKVISMSLFGKDTKYTYGAIRNAQLAPVIYPGWTIRFYIAERNGSESLQVPPRILTKLQTLGAELATVSGAINIESKYWRYLVADDPNVKEFIIRDCDKRLMDREKISVDKWLGSTETFHYIKDHPKHSKTSIPEGLWGARREKFLSLLGSPIKDILQKGGDMLQSVISPAVKGSALCHDSVTCGSSGCKLFPVGKRRKTVRRGIVYIGQSYNQYMDPASDDYTELDSLKDAEKCAIDS